MPDVYLLLGSNLGDRQLFLQKATKLITERVGNLLEVSSLYETAAWGLEDQPPFVNQALKLATTLSPQQVLQQVLQIEKELGRERIQKWGTRVIDIDILFYGDAIVNEEDLKIPHPFFQVRRFAVEPMLEIAPDFVHPRLKKAIKSIALELTDELFVEKI